MIDGVREAVASLDAKMSRQFHWLVGILLSALIAMLGMMGGVLSVALRH